MVEQESGKPDPISKSNPGNPGYGGTNTSAASSTSTSSTSTKKSSVPITLYRRELKPPCVAFSSEDGRNLFREALVEGTMENYFRLAEQFRTQDEPAYCGLSTLTMVLNALAVDPGRAWKGPWRWYHESMLDCCAPLEVVRDKGITMPALGCLARCNGLTVHIEGPDTHSIEDLRAVVEKYCSGDLGKVIVVSYDRRGLKQTGTGHFSPVGGYHRSQDLVLIMDTARFKLPPHWVPLPVLWEAMKRVDPETGKARGYMLLEKADSLSHRLFTVNARNYSDWPKVASWVDDVMTLVGKVSEEKLFEGKSCLDGDGNGDGEGSDECSSGGGTSSAIAGASARTSASSCGGDSKQSCCSGVGEKSLLQGHVGGSVGSGKRLREAKTVAEFVPRLLELLPPAVSGLLTTFSAINASEHALGQAQEGVVLQAIQGTEVYQEVTRIERGKRDDRSDSDPSNRGDGTAHQDQVTGPPPVPALISHTVPSPPPSPSSLFSPHDWECRCSSRHVVSVMTYALLLLLHERETNRGDGEDGLDGDAGSGDLPEFVWQRNPLLSLPKIVADEAKHVARMINGLVEMCECSDCTTP